MKLATGSRAASLGVDVAMLGIGVSVGTAEADNAATVVAVGAAEGFGVGGGFHAEQPATTSTATDRRNAARRP